MADIVLINPNISTLRDKKDRTSLNIAPPLGLVCMGSYLEKNGFNVKIIDGSVSNTKHEIEKSINNAVFVGFSVMSSQIAHALELSAFVKDIDPTN